MRSGALHARGQPRAGVVHARRTRCSPPTPTAAARSRCSSSGSPRSRSPGRVLPGRRPRAGCTRRRAARSTTTRSTSARRRQPRPVPVPLRHAQQREELRLQVRLRGGARADAEGVRVVARAVAARLEAVELRARRARGLRPRRPHVPGHVLVGERRRTSRPASDGGDLGVNADGSLVPREPAAAGDRAHARRSARSRRRRTSRPGTTPSGSTGRRRATSSTSTA